MSNHPPAINPTGTKYRQVKMYGRREGLNREDRDHTKAFEKLLKVVGEYIRADYKVTFWEHPPGYANVNCETPFGFPIHEEK